MYLATAYAVEVSSISQAGAVRNGTSVVKAYGSPRRPGSPVSAIAREICVISSSSVNSHGVLCAHASHA